MKYENIEDKKCEPLLKTVFCVYIAKLFKKIINLFKAEYAKMLLNVTRSLFQDEQVA
jgi:hypothetical protein